MSDRKLKYFIIISILTVFSILLGTSLANAEVIMWGHNNYGLVWDGTLADSAAQPEVNGLGEVSAVAGGGYHAIALKTDGTVWTWGYNGKAAGDGTTAAERTTPVQVKGLVDVAAIAGGGYHTIALKADGTVWTWGYNGNGQLGDGTAADRTTPVQVKGLVDVAAIAGGGYHTIALKTDGTVWTWGYNGNGQLGDGTTADRTTPVQVKGLVDVAAIAGGGYHTIALKTDGTVWTWGYNGNGQLGDGTAADRTTPVQVKGLVDVAAIAGGGYHTIALKTDGTVWTWGYNGNGQLGDGTTADRTTPVQVKGLVDVAAIAGGGYHTIALKTDGTVWTWGYNGNGQLGDGTAADRTTPVQVKGLSDVAVIAGGEIYTIVLLDNLPDMTVSSLAASSFAGPGEAVTIIDTTKNSGGGDSPASTTGFYLSTNSLLDADDIVLGNREVPALAAAGGSSTAATSLTIPPGTATGVYYLIAKADVPGLISETNEANNTRIALIKIGPDLVVSSLVVSSIAGAGAEVIVTDTTENSGGGSAPLSRTAFYLSTDGLLDGSDIWLKGRAVPALAAGGSSTAATSLTIPPGTATGVYYIIAKADARGLVSETNEANNTRSASIRIGPDLVVSSISVPSFAGAGAEVIVTDTTENSGGGSAPLSRTAFYLSTDGLLDGSDIWLKGRAVPVLAAGGSSTAATSLTIPPGTATGVYYIIAKADARGLVSETNEANNTRSASIRIGPDLVVSSLSAPSFAGAGAEVIVTDTTENSGGGSAPSSRTAFYLSTDGLLDGSDIKLKGRAVPALAAGGSSTAATSLMIPSGITTGVYYIIAKADGPDLVSETNETNNTRIAPIKIGPDLVVSSFTVPSIGKHGAAVIVTDTTENSGGGDSPASTTGFYLSTDGLLDADDVVLGSRAVPVLAAGGSSTAATSLMIPPGTTTGVYYIIAKADGPDLVSETNETNNARVAPIKIGPDLVVSSLSAPSFAEPGAAFIVTDTTENSGGGGAPSSRTAFYLSTDGLLDGSDIKLKGRAVPVLAAGGSSTAATSLAIPSGTATGNYYIIAKADGPDLVSETNETNNTRGVLISIGPDLIILSLTVPPGAGAGGSIKVTDTTMNSGSKDAAASTTSFYLSADNVLDSSDELLGSRAVPALAAGAANTGTTSMTIPSGTATGSYYIIAKADGLNLVTETNETNNTRSASIRIGPDLTIVSFTVPPGAGAGGSIKVIDTTMNSGGGDAVASTTNFYLSADSLLDSSDELLGSRSVPALAGGAGSTGTTSLTIPSGTVPGSYYIIARTDVLDMVTETNETNNTRSASIRIGPDLTILSLTVPSAAGVGATINVTDTTMNSGGGDAAASTTSFYLSVDSIPDGSDKGLGSRAVPALAGGRSSRGTTSLKIPSGTAPGIYYIIAKADVLDLIFETNEANNTGSAVISIGADLSISSLTVPFGAEVGATINVKYVTKNSAGEDAPASTTDFYLSRDSVLDAGDVLLGRKPVPALAAGASSSGEVPLIISSETMPEIYYIIAKADGPDLISESDESNNTKNSAITIGPDLTILPLTAPAGAEVGATISVMDTTRNIGGGYAGATKTRFYLSADSVPDASDLLLGSRAVSGLAAGASSTGSTSLTIPSGTAAGSYYILAKADATDLVIEAHEINNTAGVSIMIGPDLIISSLTVPSGAEAGAMLNVKFVTRNSAVGGNAPASTTSFYLSPDSILDGSDVLLGRKTVPALAAGAGSSGTVQLVIPLGTVPGTYYIIAKADGPGLVSEADETNNTLYDQIAVQ